MRNGFRLDRELARRNIRTLNATTHVGEKLGHRDDVADLGDVMKMYWLICEQRGRHCGKGGILCPANMHLSFEPASTLDFEAVHYLLLIFVRIFGV